MSSGRRTAVKESSARGLAAKPSQKDVQRLVALYSSGRLNRAELKARKLIRAFPGTLVLYDILSAAQAGQGKLGDAARSCQRALEVNPEHIGAHSNLGVIYRKLGRLDEAVSSCRKALCIDPGHAEARINLGVALRSMGRLEEAVHCYREALKTSPGSAVAHSNLGIALKDLGRVQEAVASHREAVKLTPGSPEVYNNLGNALAELGSHEEAVDSFQRALKLRPDNADVHSNLGNALVKLGRFEEAVASYEHALEIDPDLVSALNGLGAFYERRNDIEKAAGYIQRALELAPDEPGIILHWSVLLRRMKQTGKAVNTLEPLTDRALPDTMRVQIHSELGKLHDLARDSKKAFGHFSIANDLQAGCELSAAVDKQAFLGQIRQMDEILTSRWVESWLHPEGGGNCETPVFLVGFPRSGTTLLDQILDAHPGLQVMEEQPALHDVSLQIVLKSGGYPAAMAKLGGAETNQLRDLYFRNIASHLVREPGTLLVDKMPLHIRYIPLIVRLFPKARIILALRHPCDVVLSNFMQHYTINEAMANFFTLEDAAHCYAKVMGLWQKCAKLLPVNYHTLKYEFLVDDFDGEVHSLLEFLGVGWDDAVRNFNQHSKERGAINTPSYQAVSEPINARARYRWKRYEDELAPVMDDLTPFIEAFGYAESPADDTNSPA